MAQKEKLDSNNIQNINSGRNPYGLVTNFFNDPSKYKLPDVFSEKHSDNDIEIYGLYKKKRVIRYVSENYPIPTIKVPIEKYKLFIPKAYGSGNFGEAPSNFIYWKTRTNMY